MKTFAVASMLAIVSVGECPLIPPPVFCTQICVYGLSVNLTDADTSDPVSGAVLTLVDGDYTETMQETDPGRYVGAGERAGTYSLTVQAEGYADTQIEEITLDEDECHVIPQTRDISLDPT